MKLVKKPWGHEKWVAETSRYIGKILTIKRGKRLSLQYHRTKMETVYVLKGNLQLQICANGAAAVCDIRPGQNYDIHPGVIHRFGAVKSDVVLFEVSSPEIHDVVRLQDDYGRVSR